MREIYVNLFDVNVNIFHDNKILNLIEFDELILMNDLYQICIIFESNMSI